jgi:MoxR-like ATPase
MKPDRAKELTEISITAENYFKIGLIYLRIAANLPVILMGETGIGKTSLIVLLSKIMNFKYYVLDIHAGITAQQITQFV